ncbi:hypothetical protein K435DRAFT_700022 [Dendrothele bispora CBS 962.96]|uniref:Uncharacterized protein n=1 Tax=Dendrothele bispora (strain CBS 962.96) TaxID=1314807 RepID=A0A4S8KRY7_DENBC|nr:hypothetical protein K435DRAFT_700022 [Dendrothele bispora CBS 962.96]
MEAYLMADVKGKDWRQAVDSLLELETAYSFKSSTKSLKNTKRPQAVQHWVSRGRKEAFPSILAGEKADSFHQSIAAWWNDLMPEWRKLEPGSEALAQVDWGETVEGPWGTIRNPGINGLYSILACMKWLLQLHHGEHKMDSGKAPSQWTLLLDDIVWVIDQLKAAESDDEHTAKKPRVDSA